MLLEKIKVMKLVMLERALQKEDAWRRVAEQFGLDTALHLKQPSAQFLLITLVELETSVEDLIHILLDLNLNEAASLISKPERLQIVRQPYFEETGDCFWDEDNVLRVKAGRRLHLKIDATGSPLPLFQWFRDNIHLTTNQDLIIPDFREEMEGLYHCVVRQWEDYGLEKKIISEDVTVKLAIRLHHDIPRISSSFPPECELECGEELKYTITVAAGPEPTYTWWHNGEVLESYKSNELWIPHVNEKSAGRYECRVKNANGESCQESKLIVKKKRPNPTKKVALIIGNGDASLKAPAYDARMMDVKLKEYGFETKVLTDEGAESIKEKVVEYFHETKPKGAFVMFYFGGHGFINKNLKYMVGCDANLAAIEEQHVVDENFVLEVVQEYDPIFIVSILDMCQTPTECNLKDKQSYQKWKNNMLQCYSTSQNRAALEKQGSKHSIYTKHLLDVLDECRSLTFVDMIYKVNSRVTEEMPDQVPQVVCTGGLYRDFKLSDKISSIQ